MKRLWLPLLISLLFAQPVWALRCGNKLVLEGSNKFDVLQRCGEPNFQDSRTELRSLELRAPSYKTGQWVPVTIDEWYYNFGPSQFMALLVFENGRLTAIKSLGYGY